MGRTRSASSTGWAWAWRPLPAGGQAAADARVPHDGGDDVRRDGHAVLARAGGGGTEGADVSTENLAQSEPKGGCSAPACCALFLAGSSPSAQGRVDALRTIASDSPLVRGEAFGRNLRTQLLVVSGGCSCPAAAALLRAAGTSPQPPVGPGGGTLGLGPHSASSTSELGHPGTGTKNSRHQPGDRELRIETTPVHIKPPRHELQLRQLSITGTAQPFKEIDRDHQHGAADELDHDPSRGPVVACRASSWPLSFLAAGPALQPWHTADQIRSRRRVP